MYAAETDLPVPSSTIHRILPMALQNGDVLEMEEMNVNASNDEKSLRGKRRKLTCFTAVKRVRFLGP